ncbi:MAG: SIR2 family protein [Magnetococcales bacterium]|nr:SIR2 family protein [Magnetococcales bacterium]
MQFVTNGPDIPERLLQAHENGQVVFFCGAGVSYPAGLCGFDDLVKEIYAGLHEEQDDIEQAAFRVGQFDTVIGLLEGRIVGGRKRVREQLSRVLTPDLALPQALATHRAILTLARHPEKGVRLITTNFDRLFEEVIAADRLTINTDQAPLLPVPKNRWNGLVYLHGLLAPAPTATDLDHLVVSSGDFGLAYLVERWAARFVSELFRNYTVCFIGYSINDPVLRYMLDALAADRLRGESPNEMFASGPFSKGKEKQSATAWRKKNVTPILYREYRKHYYLHNTLRRWAGTFRDGVLGKEYIVAQYATTKPLPGTLQDFVGRMLWALSDKSGLPAKRFADHNPVPSLDWLAPLCENRYRYADLDRFGVPSQPVEDDKLTFSLMCRPTPCDRAPRMMLVEAGAAGRRWDDVMFQLAHWLTRHLDDPTLILWLANRGGKLHNHFAGLIENRLDELVKLERDGEHDKLKQIQVDAPNAIPCPSMRTLWRLFLTGCVQSPQNSLDLSQWYRHLNRDGFTATLRLELREMLTPRVVLRDPFRWGEAMPKTTGTRRIKDLVGWEIVLSADSVHSNLEDLKENMSWCAASWPDWLVDATALLRDALDLMRELDGIDDRQDRSYIAQPSISEHRQNNKIHDWTALIDLTRDAWLATAARWPDRARLVAANWWQVPYPLFKRLAFFAAAQANVIPHRLALDWLLADDHCWLWSVETQREVVRLLVALAPNWDGAELAELEQVILVGPSCPIFGDDTEAEEWTWQMERNIWFRLAKLDAAGAAMGTTAKARLTELYARHPTWQLAADESDEFPFWVGHDGSRQMNITPKNKEDLINWLKEYATPRYRQEDDWRDRCRDDFLATTDALKELSRAGEWPIRRWSEALQAWFGEPHLKQSWGTMSAVLDGAPDDILKELVYPLGMWLQCVANTLEESDPIFFNLVQRVLAFEDDNGEEKDPVSRALNHPVGLVTGAVLHWWYRQSLEDGQGLSSEIKSLFTNLCNPQVVRFRHGRIVLAASVIALFRVDQDWSVQHLLPLFDWQRPGAEPLAMWQSCLGSLYLYRPLLEAIKQPFLAAAEHYAQLGMSGNQYAGLLTFAALEGGGPFLTKELATATRLLPLEGLRSVAQTLVNALDGSGAQHKEYWHNRVSPYLKSIWPQSPDARKPAAETIARLYVAAGEAFPEAVGDMRDWLQPVEHPDNIAYLASQAKHPEHFPEETLDFLRIVVGDGTQWLSNSLRGCLQAIRTAKPGLEEDDRFKKLDQYLRKYE